MSSLPGYHWAGDGDKPSWSIRQSRRPLGEVQLDFERFKTAAYLRQQNDIGVTSDSQLIDAMMDHPILINRPIVVAPLGVKLCRPSEEVLDLLPVNQQGAFAKEDGELVVDAAGKRIG